MDWSAIARVIWTMFYVCFYMFMALGSGSLFALIFIPHVAWHVKLIWTDEHG